MRGSNSQRLSAVLFADVEGYSRLMLEDEAGTLQQFRQLIDERVRPLLSEHAGRLVKTTGDGFIAEFSSAVAAVECAVAIQNASKTQQDQVSGRETLNLRIGINAGEIVVESDDIFGTEVNIAARLEKLAGAGEVVVSDTVHGFVRRHPGLLFHPLGPQTLKNMAEPVFLYRVASKHGNSATHRKEQPSGTSVARESPRVAWTTQRPSILITPFLNLSDDEEQEYFCNGLTFDLTTDLSRFKNLDVVAAHTALFLSDERRNVREINQKFGICYLLEGSIQRTGKIIRVNAQLIDARTDRHIWADRFVRPFEQLPSLQDELNRAIVTALALNVDAAERERTRRKLPSDMNAYDSFLRGLHLWNEHLEIDQTRATLVEAQSFFETARSLDPQFARAWSTLAYTRAWAWRQGWENDEALRQALHDARHAVRLEPDSHDTHWDLAYCLLTQGDFEGARREYELASKLNPYDVLLMTEMAEFFCCAGEHAEALRLIDEVLSLSTYTVDYSLQTKSLILYCLHDYRSALKCAMSIRQVSAGDYLMQAILRAQLAEQHSREKNEDLASAEDRLSAGAFRSYLGLRSDRTAEQELRTYAFLRSEDADHWRKGLERVGLLAENVDG